MKSHQILQPNILKEEIRKSHERSKRYGIDPNCVVDPDQVRLTPKELKLRQNQNRIFFDTAVRQLKDLYSIIRGGGFVMILADHEGYFLHIIGDPSTLEGLSQVNCAPGFRWSERDVGTTATALSIARKIAVQITEKESFCQRGRGYTNSAAPIFDDNDRLLGVVIATGNADQVHSHTLGMMITAARSIEKEMRLLKNGNELLLQNQSMKAVLESIDSGIIVIDREGKIIELNNHGRAILKGNDFTGSSIQSMAQSGIDWASLFRMEAECMDREFFLNVSDGQTVQVMATIRPIYDSSHKVGGYVIKFDEINRIRKLVNEMAGSHALFTLRDIIGASSAIQQAKKFAMKAARSRSSVLIIGETGTGKELFAQAIHNQSDRRERPFVTINCGAIPRELLESELFGYVEGAFTGAAKGGRQGKFELANGGTVFLDEIGDMPIDMQVKMLRVLQSGEVIRIGEHKPHSVDVRIIAATNVDIRQSYLRGSFRQDLFYRLNVFPITIPPLRERPEDIILFARHFLERRRRMLNSPVLGFTPRAESLLLNYNWMGNVRELENVVERLLNIVDEQYIRREHLAFLKVKMGRALMANQQGALLEVSERQTIIDAMQAIGQNIALASRMLGISRPTLYRKLKKYNLVPRTLSPPD
jgi:transcriptional regulator with PAS, ATPase and Fis domain